MVCVNIVFTVACLTLDLARTQLASPKKAGSSTGPGTAQRSRMLSIGNKTPVMVQLPLSRPYILPLIN